MKQYYRNIFFYYRGPSGRVGDESGYDRQLEDNTTKALINVMDMASPEMVLQPFLKRFCGITCLNAESVDFAFQRRDIRQPKIGTRVALAIAPESQWSPPGAEVHEQGRPDAWIWRAGDFAVLVENKVLGGATKKQVHRHIDSAHGWTRRNCTVRLITWAQVHAFFRELVQGADHLEPRTAFLVRQFEEYLRMTNLSASTVLEIEDFAYFATAEEDRHPVRKRAVERKFCDIAEAIAKQPTMREALRLYGSSAVVGNPTNPGRFNRARGDFWISIGPRERRTNAHFTVRISQSGISVDCFAPHRTYTRRIIRAIREHPTEFLAAMRKVTRRDPFYIRLREAYYEDPKSSYKGQNIKGVHDFLEVHPREIHAGNLDLLICDPIQTRLSSKRLRPELFLVRYFELGEVVGVEHIAGLVADAAGKMLPFLRFALKYAGDPREM